MTKVARPVFAGGEPSGSEVLCGTFGSTTLRGEGDTGRGGASLGILVTYHDERELLTECLESILDQLGPEDEVLVYDDASAAPAARYVPPGARVEVVRGEVNRGPACGRNALLQRCGATYIHFHDADDLFEKSWVERVRSRLQETGADVVLTELASYRGGEMVSARVMGLRALLAGGDLVRFCVRGAILPSAGTYRRATVAGIGGYRESLWQSEDYDFHIRLAASGVKYAVIDEPLARLRIRPESRSQRQVEVWCSAVEAIRMLSKELALVYRPDLADAAARAGSVLYRLGERQAAREAFALAGALGPPPFSGQTPPYRVLARAFGPEAAERACKVYRRLPEGLRRRIRA